MFEISGSMRREIRCRSVQGITSALDAAKLVSLMFRRLLTFIRGHVWARDKQIKSVEPHLSILSSRLDPCTFVVLE